MISRILIPTDGTPCSEHATRVAFELAKRVNARVLLTHIADERGTSPFSERRGVRQRFGKVMLEYWVDEAERLGLFASYMLDSSRNVIESIVNMATDEHCDLIVMGTHGREGIPRLVQGSVAEGVLKNTPLPIMLVHHTPRPFEPLFHRILVAVDGDEISDIALEHATELAQALKASLDVLHVIPDVAASSKNFRSTSQDVQRFVNEAENESHKIIAHAWSQIRGSAIEPSRIEVFETRLNGAKIQDVILRHAKQRKIDLIVMGTHTRTGLARFVMGSVAEGVVHHTSLPVLLIRGIEARETQTTSPPEETLIPNLKLELEPSQHRQLDR
jgi:nucleotide-binding universal stress UspA family protein